MHLFLIIPIIVFLVLLFIKTPVAYSILIATLTYFVFLNDTLPMDMVVQSVIATSESFTYLAIPFFVCAGVVFNYSGISSRLFSFAELLVGHYPGAQGQVNVLASTMMGGLSGSANADAAMNSKILVPEMLKNGYSKGFSTALTAASSCITPIIPPGIILIMYAAVSDVSISKMFMAGYIPGLLMCGCLMLVVYIISKKRGYTATRERRASAREILHATRKAIWALFLPFGLLMGMRFGMFTPTEAGAMSVFYALLVGGFIYKELTWKDLWPIVKETVEGTAGVMFIIAAANSFSVYFAWERLPMIISEWMISSISSPVVMLLLINLLLLVIGCFFDGAAALLLLGPLLIPTVQAMGIDLIHFGIIVSINLTLGGITPPFGGMMFITTSITRTRLEEYAIECIPFVACLIALLLVLTFVPDIVLFLPRLLF